MASVPTRELKIGKIIDNTLAVIERNVVPAAIFVAALTVIDSPITYFTQKAPPLQALSVSLLTIVVAAIASFLLLSAMLRRIGLVSRPDDDVFLRYLGLSVLSAIATLVGLILLVIPALFLMARWSLAQPLVVARGDGIMQAFGQSWEKTRGNEFPIIVTVLALVIPLTAISILCSVLLGKGNLVGIVVGQIASSGASMVALAMGVALYGMIVGMPKAAAPTAE